VCNLNTVDATGLLQWVHSTIGFHRYTHLLSRRVINLCGKFNV